MSVMVTAVAIFFLAMGVVGLAAPARIVGPFGMTAAGSDARNEIAAVYGGFGVAMAALLLAAPIDLRAGAVLAVAVALAGMAGGRILRALFDAPRSFYPCWFYCCIEVAMAAALVSTIR